MDAMREDAHDRLHAALARNSNSSLLLADHLHVHHQLQQELLRPT